MPRSVSNELDAHLQYNERNLSIFSERVRVGVFFDESRHSVRVSSLDSSLGLEPLDGQEIISPEEDLEISSISDIFNLFHQLCETNAWDAGFGIMIINDDG